MINGYDPSGKQAVCERKSSIRERLDVMIDQARDSRDNLLEASVRIENVLTTPLEANNCTTSVSSNDIETKLFELSRLISEIWSLASNIASTL